MQPSYCQLRAGLPAAGSPREGIAPDQVVPNAPAPALYHPGDGRDVSKTSYLEPVSLAALSYYIATRCSRPPSPPCSGTSSWCLPGGSSGLSRTWPG